MKIVCIMVFMWIVISIKSGVFEICNIWKGDEQKNCLRYFEICKYAFLIFEKAYEQKIVLGILRFVSMVFNVIIF